MEQKLVSIRHWRVKFANAGRGIWVGSRLETSCVFHSIAAVLVLIAAWLLSCSVSEWCLLLLCIGLVFSLELMNSAVERLAGALCDSENADVRDALDSASGAVLVGSVAAAIVGALVLGLRLWDVWG